MSNNIRLKVLLTGATGYIGKRLLPVLLETGYTVVCLVRDQREFDWSAIPDRHMAEVILLEADLSDLRSLQSVPSDISAAYYLVHSMSSPDKNFLELEAVAASNFIRAISATEAKQIIYLSGIVNDSQLSQHLESRKNVERILQSATVPLTVLRAAIIIGSGSASFEIIRDLVEKLPVMIAPKWLNTRCQPIGIRNVVEYLIGVLLNSKTYGRDFDIGGTDILTYKQMLLQFAKMRGLKRVIIIVPVFSPKLSSWWLIFVTSTTYSLARNLVESMHNEVVCRNMSIHDLIPITLLSYQESLHLAFDKISQKNVTSTWQDSLVLSKLDKNVLETMQAPKHGVLTDVRRLKFKENREAVVKNIWTIGGKNGWYAGNWMWRLRGSIDKWVGGVGLRQNRKRFEEMRSGDAIDFWRVLVADKKNGRLLLYAEMKLPGEAWLEFRVENSGPQFELIQTATFRPLGLWGRIYWYAVLPFHGFIFPALAKKIVRVSK